MNVTPAAFFVLQERVAYGHAAHFRDTILTTMRRMQKLGIEELIELTCDCVRRAVKNG